jgi:hypothetical protein
MYKTSSTMIIATISNYEERTATKMFLPMPAAPLLELLEGDPDLPLHLPLLDSTEYQVNFLRQDWLGSL